MKIITDISGSSIIQEEDGWWCYAYYDDNGHKKSTGFHVGSDVPASIISSGRNIPYEKLRISARTKRAVLQRNEEPIMARIMRQRGLDTRTPTGEDITKHGLIILAQFKDRKFKHSKEDFVKMLTQDGYNVNGATGSAKEYFDDQFNGAVKFEFEVSSIATLPSNMAYYGRNGDDGHDENPHKMVIDACKSVDKEINFAKYDDDNDGFVDNVFIFFAGGDEADGAGENCIWSHSWDIYDGANETLILDGAQIGSYACTAELTRQYTDFFSESYENVLAGIGTFCHEYFHTFGIPDMYDTDYGDSGGISAGLWGWTSLMDAGNQNNDGNSPPYLNAIEREYLGLSEPVIIRNNGTYTLEPINLNGRYYRLNTDYKDEYYLLEYRGDDGWDAYVGGSGMLIYHIDKSNRNAGFSDTFGETLTAAERWGATNEINCRPNHQCADLVEADSRKESFTDREDDSYYDLLDNIQNIYFPTRSVTSLTPDGKPSLKFWSGTTSEISITNIKRTDNGVSFNVIGYTETQTPPSVASIKAEAFSDAAIILFESDEPYDGEARLSWGRTGSPSQTIDVKPYEPGKYSYTLEGLESGTYIIKVWFELGGLTGEEKSSSFKTKRAPTVIWPYIYMGSVTKNTDGTLPAGTKLPLRVYNAGKASGITWTFNGEAVTAGGDGYLTVTKSGTLKAHIVWNDGSEETIAKEIKIGEEVQK